MSTKLPPHPGDVLAERLQKLGVSSYKLGNDIGTTPVAAYQLISTEKFGGRTRRSLTARMAILLAKYFGDTPEDWMLIQTLYDLAVARKDPTFTARLAKVKPFSPKDASMLTGEAASPERRPRPAPKPKAATKKGPKPVAKKAVKRAATTKAPAKRKR
ncbi:MAG: HigA family addiction module antitoxin [Rhodanobacter sp.]